MNEGLIQLLNVPFKPKELWMWFKMRLLGTVVDSKIIRKVNYVFLNQHVVDDNEFVPYLKVGRDVVLALVTFGVFIYIYID
jgi:hypothetical protein